jgi:hypothetical protein
MAQCAAMHAPRLKRAAVGDSHATVGDVAEAPSSAGDRGGLGHHRHLAVRVGGDEQCGWRRRG